MLWLIIAVISYFLFALASLGDKYLLIGPPNPRVYAFFVGILGISVLILIPFVGFSIPDRFQLIVCFAAGAVYLFALLGLFEGLEKFEASRIIPAVGGFLPIFTFLLVYFLFGSKEIPGLKEIIAFALLISGTVLVTRNPSVKISWQSFKISIITALLFSLSFILAKYVYLNLSFWTGFIWLRIGTFLTALSLLFFKEIRKGIFSQRAGFNKKTNQGIGALAFILQNWAIALAGLVYLSLINALQGLQYLFLFVFVLIFPGILKEKISPKIIFQKITALLLIGFGLLILTML